MFRNPANAISNFNHLAHKNGQIDSYWAEKVQEVYDATRPKVEKTRRNTRKATR